MTNPGDANQDRPIDAETYERLCARLLGELEGADANNLDADCADSEALTSERERIAATIALVQDTYRAEPALSEAAMAKVMAAARQESTPNSGSTSWADQPVARVHQLPWWRNTGLRAAAAIAALVGGVFGVLAIEGGSSTEYVDSVADAETPRRSSRRSAAAGDGLLGKADSGRRDGDSQEQVRMADSLTGMTSPLQESGDRSQTHEALLQQADGLPRERSAELEAAHKFAGREADQDLQPEGGRADAGDQGILDSPESSQSSPAGGLVPPSSDSSVDRATVGDATNGLEELASAGLDDGGSGKAGEGAAGPPSAGLFFDQAGSIESKKGNDDFFLGRGENKAGGMKDQPPADASKDPALAAVADPGAGSGGGGGNVGAYRGPGDSIAPEPATIAPGPASPAGPSSPGPTAPGSPRPTAADKASESATETRKELSGLSSLGYAATEEAEVSAGKREHDALSVNVDGETVDSRGLGYLDSPAEAAKDGRHYGEFFNDVDADGRTRRVELTEEQLNKLTARYSDEFFRSCQPRPSERPRDMFFRFYGDNPFEYAPQDKRSTFSVDVDTASYTLSRSYLERGLLPEKAQVRTEEFLNYFDADLPAPTDEVFAITTEVAPSRFGGTPDRLMLRVGVRGKEISKEERDPLALTFVVDVSGSMREGDRLELVKHALRLLLTQLDARDRISLVAFSNEARVVLPMTAATDRALIEAALHPLQPGGGTNAEAGLTVGYEMALTGIDPKVTSRVIFLSDGVANIGQTDQDRLSESVARQREQGIYLNTVGVGMNNHNDVFLERLADRGDGVCDYMDDADSAKRALVDRFTGALLPIASDVKVQVVFDDSVVARYRLLGYENRAIADADFRNDAVDAGEIGAGHQVVALYEIDLAPRTDPLAEPLASGYPMASVLLRWKEPKRTGQHPLEIQVSEIEKQVAFPGAKTPFAETSLGFRRDALVAQFAEFLRRSTHAQGDSIQELLEESKALAPLLNDGDFDEFVALVRRAEPLLVAEQIRVLQDELGMTMDEYRRLAYNRALLAELNLIQENAAVLDGIRDANRQVEGQIRDLIYKQLKNR